MLFLLIILVFWKNWK